MLEIENKCFVDSSCLEVDDDGSDSSDNEMEESD